MRNFAKIKIVLSCCMIALFMFGGCSYTDQQGVQRVISDVIDSPEVEAIKAMTLEDTEITLGDLFGILADTTYELYDPAEDGNKYVTIKGSVQYMGKPVVATIQYKHISDEEYSFYALEYNEVPQNQLEIVNLFDFLFEEYLKSLEVTVNEDDLTNEELTGDEIEIDLMAYRNGRFGYSIKTPETWSLEESQNGDGAFLYSSEEESIIIFAQYLVLASNLEEYIENNYEGDWVRQEHYVQGSENSLKLILDDFDSKKTVILAEKNGTIYVLSRTSLNQEEEFNEIFKLIENTFEVY